MQGPYTPKVTSHQGLRNSGISSLTDVEAI